MGATLRRLIAIAAVLLTSSSEAAGPVAARPGPSGPDLTRGLSAVGSLWVKRRDAVQLVATPARTSVIPGEPILVESSLTLVMGPGLNLPVLSDVQFDITSEDGRRLTSSRRIHVASRCLRSCAEEPAPEEKFVPAGATVKWVDDLGLYAFDELGPGKYRVVARLGAASAPAFEISVERPVAPLATAIDGGRAVAIYERAEGDSAALFIRTTPPGDLRYGSAVRLLERPGMPEVSSAAIAVAESPQDSRTWFAVLEAGALSIGVAGPNGLAELHRGPVVELENARLLNPGFRRKDEVVFVVLGGSVDGTQLRIARLRFDNGAKFEMSKVGPLVAGKSPRVAAAFQEETSLLRVGIENPHGALTVHSFGLDGRQAAAPEEPPIPHRPIWFLRSTGGELDALGEPMDMRDFPSVHVSNTVERGPQLPTPPNGSEGLSVVRDTAGVTYLASTNRGEVIWTNSLEKHRSDWRTVAKTSPRTLFVSLFRSPQGLRVEWFDPARGLRSALLP